MHDISNVCTAMDVNDGPVSSSEDSDISHETQTPPQVCGRCRSSSDSPPPTKPARSADIGSKDLSRDGTKLNLFFSFMV